MASRGKNSAPWESMRRSPSSVVHFQATVRPAAVLLPGVITMSTLSVLGLSCSATALAHTGTSSSLWSLCVFDPSQPRRALQRPAFIDERYSSPHHQPGMSTLAQVHNSYRSIESSLTSISTRLSAHPSALICLDTDIRGEVTVGAGSVVHPRAAILAVGGPIVIGRNFVLEETAVLVNR